MCYDRIKCRSFVSDWKHKMFNADQIKMAETSQKNFHSNANSDITRDRILESRTAFFKMTNDKNLL